MGGTTQDAYACANLSHATYCNIESHVYRVERLYRRQALRVSLQEVRLLFANLI